MKAFSASVMSLSESKDPEQWDPLENTRGVSAGQLLIPKKQIKEMLSNQTPGEQLSGVLEIYPDDETWERCCDQIPEQGFLVSEIFKSLIPLDRQRKALSKFVKGEVVNQWLVDFFFDAGKARTPDTPILGLATEDLEFLKECFPKVTLNKEQELAVAKGVDAPDLFMLQGPPGTGKTLVEACITTLLVGRRGERVLMSSQSNVAIDELLSRIPKRPEFRLVRIGRKEAESDFSQEQGLFTWLSWVHDACNMILTKEQKLAADLEELDRIWPRFADMAGEHKKVVKSRSAREKQLRTIEEKSAKLTDSLTELKRWYSDYSSAAAAVEQATKQLNNRSIVTDLAEWVRLIEAPQRGDIFGQLRVWQEENRLPEVIQPLLADPPDNKDSSASADSSGKSGLVKWFLQCFTPRQRQQPSHQKTEPNWAVECLNANTLLNRLRDLQGNLPKLLESSQEAERLCTIAAASEVGEAAWTELTNDLTNALKSSGKAVAGVLEIDSIATALKPKKSFTTKLTETRTFLQEVLANIPAITDSLEKALTAVAEASASYLNSRLAETGKQIKKVQSSINSLKNQHSKTAESLTNINREVKQLESAWAESFEALPYALRSRISPEVPPIGSKGSKILNKGQASYLKDTEETVNHHKLWGATLERWIRRLERPTEADKKILSPMYLKKVNIAGVTCSWCGSKQILGRDEFSRFDTAIIDEVSKALPTELLLVAILAARVILGGDYRQLPPTFKEGRNLERSYGELAETDPLFEQAIRFKNMVNSSLFEHLYRNSPETIRQALFIQLRFHPQIMEVDNQFYDGQLQCGIKEPDKECDHGLAIKTRMGEFLTRKNHVLWIDTSRDSRGRRVYERQVGDSIANDTEAQCVVRLVKLLNQAAGQAGKEPGSVGLGVITFYGAQVRCIKDKLDKLSPDIKKYLTVRVDSVDNFQGMQREIVILSMVRSKPGRIGDFAKRYQRINVGMSRAQQLLLILGAVDTFAKVEVPFPNANGKTISRRCYTNILNILKKHGGLRNTKELLQKQR